jgi:hypothetical protein
MGDVRDGWSFELGWILVCEYGGDGTGKCCGNTAGYARDGTYSDSRADLCGRESFDTRATEDA